MNGNLDKGTDKENIDMIEDNILDRMI